MLRTLTIQNLAVIEALTLEFASGMTVLTGETGAGKSILLDALGMVLGDKADTSLVRFGCDKAEVSGEFDLSACPLAKAWLEGESIDLDDSLLIRRVLTAEGRSKAWINGTPVTIKQLQQLGDLLVDIHGQHAHQSLLKPLHQRETLDRFAQADKLLAATQFAWRAWQQRAAEYDDLKTRSAEKQARLDYLRFALEEFEQLAPQLGEFAQIEQEHARLSHFTDVQNQLTEAEHRLSEADDNLLHQLDQVFNGLSSIAAFEPKVKESMELIESARIQLQEAHYSLSHLIEVETHSERPLQQLESRMADYLRLARKHQLSADELVTRYESLQEEYTTLTHSDETLHHLAEQMHQAQAQFMAEAQALSQVRKQTAVRMQTELKALLKELELSAHFVVDHVSGPEYASAQGIDRIEFLVSTNPGQPPKSLSKVASGGELSRISLALEVLTADVGQIPVMVFDEVDVGIGGSTAEIVGRRLAKLAQQRQILVVTHQSQVAAQGDQHLFVSKHQTADTTHSQVRTLSHAERIDEIARMLGGIEITPATLARAQEMLAHAPRR
jgi:DNA repair protein RecN (Recombination protein N)